MSHQINRLLFPASSEFTALCRSQITNLQEGLEADYGAVYLTKELADRTRQLIPIVVYPEDTTTSEEEYEEGMIISSQDSLLDHTLFELPSSANGRDLTSPLTITQPKMNPNHPHQLVFPLLHENVMMGLLVVARQSRQWSEWEFSQIQRTAGTIALACVLDQRHGLSQQKLRQQQWQQEQQRDRLDDILHQLRNPLMALRTFGKLLLRRLSPEDHPKNYSLAENLMRESERLQQLLQDMGDYLDQINTEAPEDITIDTETTAIPDPNSGIKSLPPSQSLSVETVNISDVITPILESTRAIAQDKNIELKTNLSHSLPPVKANQKALPEVINNLLDNALKYTPQNGTIEVILKEETSQKQSIIIRDNGLGIPPEDQPKIFERHYRGVQSKTAIPGTGLGLAIVKEYVEQMAGEIKIISPATPPNNPQKGTAFIVSLFNDSD